jgi:hypothetical protein
MNTVTFTRPAFDAPLAIGFGLVVLLTCGLWLRVIAKQDRRAAAQGAVLLVVLLAAAALGDWLGLFARQDLLPPPFVVLVTATLCVVTAFGFGRTGRALATQTPTQTLIALQIFRLPLEILMLRAALVGIMPTSFSMRGYNWDVATGTVALILVMAYRAKLAPPRVVLWLWNLGGISFLLVIAVLAALTSPTLAAFGRDASQLNTWVLYFPYALLPTVLVPLAVLGHVLMTRHLLATPPTSMKAPL